MNAKQILENTLSVGHKGKDLVRLTTGGELLIGEETIGHAITQFRMWNDTLLYKTNGGLVFFTREKKHRIEGNFFLNHSWADDTRCILLKEENDEDVYYTLNLNFEIERLVFQHSFVKTFYRNYCFCLEGNVLSCYTTDGYALWRHELHNLLGGNSTITSDLVALDDRLFFSWNDSSSRTSGITCLAIETGRTIENSAMMSGWVTLVNNKLIATNRKRILRMDVNSFDIETLDFEDQLSSLLGISSDKFSVTNELFFFVGLRSSHVGAIDMAKRKVLWTKPLDVKENTFNKQILTFDSKLCVVDARNVLYLFEYSPSSV